ncbi:gamma-aminobutyrate transaminase POP2 [Cucumis melo var. makuwa]|uniref:Gamma-aminobutyrate transaminase POP2 n=1 Tax=Cucumis melo var. makuwa TaxID=1194695 RepID=A0A5A7SPG4_CUCMM|nr:gamma-aminobutyrate transaminase POP2 [Cucumis melo var. makuwa]TYK03486.1 gamma-aminobutyrate transaminase POP2 [Cucumis melo var. makuwa]
MVGHALVDKRKRSMQQFETYDLICECMEAATDQLKTIAEWPEKAMSREDAMAVQVIELMEAIPNLTMAKKSTMSFSRINFLKTDVMFLEFADDLDNLVGGSSSVGDNSGSSFQPSTTPTLRRRA